MKTFATYFLHIIALFCLMATCWSYTLMKRYDNLETSNEKANYEGSSSDSDSWNHQLDRKIRQKRSTSGSSCIIEIRYPNNRKFYLRPYGRYVVASPYRVVWQCHVVISQLRQGNGFPYMFTWKNRELSVTSSGLRMINMSGNNNNMNSIFWHSYDSLRGGNLLKTSSAKYISVSRRRLAGLTNSNRLAINVEVLANR